MDHQVFEFDHDEEFVTTPDPMSDSAIYFDGSKADERVTPSLMRIGCNSGVIIHVEDEEDEHDDVVVSDQVLSKAIPVPNLMQPPVRSRNNKHDEKDTLSQELSKSVVLEVLAFQSKVASSLSGADIGSHIDAVSDLANSSQPTKVGLDDFESLSVIGKGAYGKVYLVRRRGTTCLFAMKVLKKASIVVHSKSHEHTKNERTILEEVQDCPFIVNLYYAFQTADKLYLVLEYAPGGELFTHLGVERMFSEEQTSFYLAELILALDHLHQLGIIYRDLKPENCLLDANGHILLTDFGLSKVSLEAKTVCGTVEFMPPEIVEAKSYDKSVDFWALGIMCFNLLTGVAPFRSNNRKTLNEKIIKAKFECPKYMSPYAKDFCIRLLKKSPSARLGSGPKGMANIKKHGFFRKINWKALANKEVQPPIVPKMDTLVDVQNFHREFTGMKLDSPPSGDRLPVARSVKGLEDAFQGFSYVNRFLLTDSELDEATLDATEAVDL